MKNRAIETKLIHAEKSDTASKAKPVATPLFPTVTYTFDSMQEMDSALSGKDHVYSRYGNPTVQALESVLASIESGKFCTAFSSGMAAIHAALAVCGISHGDIVLASRDLYGATFDLLENIFGTYGVRTELADFNDLIETAEKTELLKPKVLIAETISNPLLKVCDLEKIAEIAHQNSAKLIVDNTFASPFLCRPLEFGADISLHSTTKYLSGHGDSTGGAVIFNDDRLSAKFDSVKKLVGGVLSVWEAHHILRGVKTLALRLERQCANAEKIANAVSAHRSVNRVFYPLIDDKLMCEKMLRGLGGGLVSVKLKDDTREAAWNFMESLKICTPATSLGDVYTLVSHSSTSSHRGMTKERRSELGISDSLVRISVGIENVNDLITDISSALENIDTK